MLRGMVALILTGAILLGGYFAVLFVVCTGGGALVFIVPIALVVVPVYLKLMKLLVVRKETTHDVRDARFIQSYIQPQSNPTSAHNVLVTYIENARHFGAVDDVIRNNLITEGGWSEQEIQGAFNIVNWHASK